MSEEKQLTNFRIQREISSPILPSSPRGEVAPALPAYRLDPHPGRRCPRGCPPHTLVVWCAPCGRWHSHGGVSPEPGAGDGHRVAHCLVPTSPYVAIGYVIEEAGVITAQEMRRSARAQKRPVQASRRQKGADLQQALL